MKLHLSILVLLAGVSGGPSLVAQMPSASKEHEILKHEEGNWDATVTMYMGPAGPYDPPVSCAS